LSLAFIGTSLVKRLFVISLPISLLVGVVYAGVIAYIETESLRTRQQDQVETQIKQLAETMAIPTWNLDQLFIRNYLNQYARSPYIRCIELLSDANLKEMTPAGCQHPGDGAILHSEPIIYEDNYIGVIVASFKVELDNERLYFILISRIPVALVAILVLFFVIFWVFHRWVVVPIQAITQSVQAFQNDGELHPVNWQSEDEIGSLVKTFNDSQLKQISHDRMITSEKDKAEKALRELQETQSQLVESEKMASLGSLVAGISHEINTPLGVAKTSASHVEDELTKMMGEFTAGTLTKNHMKHFIDQFEDGLHLLTANLNRASELMTSFKQVSADQSHDEIRAFNLKEYLDETLYTLKPNLKRYHVAVTLDCNDDLFIESFPGAFSQIITNLIMNSLLHAYSQEDQGNIQITIVDEVEQYSLIYRDDGCGMPEEVRRKIFDPFFTTKRGSGGTGLGMHIIYNLVTIKLQGSIEVQSKLGHGTTFSMTLPKQIRPPEKDHETD